MIDKELLAKFDRIQDLPVSEEMLGAYFEGNLDLYEMNDVCDIANNDSMLQSIIEETTSSAIDNQFDIEPIHSDNFYNEGIYENALNGTDCDYPQSYLDPDEFIEESDYGAGYHDFDMDNTFDVQSFDLPDIPFF